MDDICEKHDKLMRVQVCHTCLRKLEQDRHELLDTLEELEHQVRISGGRRISWELRGWILSKVANAIAKARKEEPKR